MRYAVIDRRELLRRAAALGLVAPFATLGSHTPYAETELVPRRVFFDDPDYQNVQVSPDGEHISYLMPLHGVRNLWVAPISDPKAGKPITGATDRDIGFYYRWAHTNQHLIYFQDHQGDENWRASSVSLKDQNSVLLTPERGVKSFLQEIDARFSEQVLLRHNQRDKRYFDLFRINLLSGDSELVFENHEYVWLITDSLFRLRLGGRYTSSGDLEVLERNEHGDWVPFMTVPIADLDGTRLLDFSDDGETLHLLDTRGRDKAALVAIDMKTRAQRILADDPAADIDEVVFSADRRPLMTRAIKDRSRWHPIDPDAEKILPLLTSYGLGDLGFAHVPLGNKKASAYFERDTKSGEYVLLDRDAGVVRPLYVQRKSLAGVPLRPMESVVIRARDGLELNGYLTRPDDLADAGRPPLVLLIHGGPYWRDYWGFKPDHQFLANRGYVVLSVNYRGSTGLGKGFVKAADHEWGGRMHDDLIDAVDWAIGKGLADPDRVGFLGGSYGGYSALMAATKTPEKFACIIDAFGISNLITFMKTIPPYWGPWFSIWHNRVGDPDTEAGRAFLAERSPINHLDRATKPILIAQGVNDVRVVAAESEQMVKALKNRDVPVTYVTFSDEGHGFVRPENRLAFAAVAEAFLAKHLGGRYLPIGNDFTGSTIKIEIGGELVPGLSH